LIKAGGGTLYFEIHRLICCIWNKEELPQQWKESIIVPIYEKGDKTDCNNYRGISLLPTAYKILSNILLARLTSYVNEIIGHHQCGFHCNRSIQTNLHLMKDWVVNCPAHMVKVNLPNFLSYKPHSHHQCYEDYHYFATRILEFIFLLSTHAHEAYSLSFNCV
jgi:hypothetical protein